MDRTMLFFALASILGLGLCYNPEIECVNGIRTDIAEFTFAGSQADDYWGNLCSNNISVHSIWAATKLYCTGREIEAGSKMLTDYCMEYGATKLAPYAEIFPVLTDDYIASLPVVEYFDINGTKIWDYPVLLSRDFYIAGMRTTSVFQKEYILHQRYGWAVYGFWGVILLIGIVNRFITHTLHARRTPAYGDVEEPGTRLKARGMPSIFSVAHHWVRMNLIIPAAFGSHHQRLLHWCTIPTRTETVIVVSFWILNLVLCCVSYEIFIPNLYYTEAIETWRYVADRSGVICYANLPVLWMFSGRNNIFLWLTGWSFSTFNSFHRHVAHALPILRSLIMTVGQLAEAWREKYWYMGGMATVTMSLLLLFSSIHLRRHSYEIFLLLHTVLSVVTIVGLFHHTAIFQGEYDPYLWPVVAIWLFDRVARIVRLAYCNLHVRFSKEATGSHSRIEIAQTWPGSALLHSPIAKWRGWENHPFTLAASSVLDGGNETVVEADLSQSPDEKAAETKIHVVAKDSPSKGSSPATSVSSGRGRPRSSASGGRYKLTFFVRPFSSWTMRLRDECLKSPSGTTNPRVFIEGPYGERGPLHIYENVIFIVGGTGISGALPYLQDHIIRAASPPSATSQSEGTRTRDITLVWTTKQSAMIRDIASPRCSLS
ncbi:hypothetical protein A1O1_08905 [Capronia coronata CBS 617.96]|uniref:FAD-binding FR-type domain-containing protein n=1 Tax=Capronia coronata CBS 617.96 TaxID=1182541 RepID=W9Y7Y0_9EURO|nr:uncharacterized protein A1O1_08905 [Capronia coronata CBS 617.96]EXJ78504.1 hypothetical protein A1O1_08905 [Capronia coronata CBS 617.96]